MTNLTNFLNSITILILSLVLLTKVSLNMIERKRICIFLPFFALGLGICLNAGFMFYGFYGIGEDVLILSKFIAALWIYYIVFRSKNDKPCNN